MRKALTILPLLVALVIAALGSLAASATSDANPQPFWMQRACPTEDSVNCFWNAQAQGNRKGHSYYVRLMPGSRGIICVFYVERAFAKHNDYCS